MFLVTLVYTILVLGNTLGETLSPSSRYNLVQTYSRLDSLNVRFIGNWPFGDAWAVAIDSARNLTYLGAGGGVYILSVADPANPLKISEKIHTRGGIVTGLFYEPYSQMLYISYRNIISGSSGGNDTIAGIELWDVSNPECPGRISSYEVRQEVFSVFVTSLPASGVFACVASGKRGLRIIDVTDPFNPVEVGSYDTPGYAVDVFVLDSIAYVADGDSGLCLINIAEPTNPVRLGYFLTPSVAYGVYVESIFAYVAASISGLRVIKVSDPRHPTEVGYYDTLGVAYSVSVGNSLACVADGINGLRIIDISDPLNPREVGYYTTPDTTPGMAFATTIFKSHSCAMVAYTRAGLRIIDISSPTRYGEELGHFSTPSPTYQISMVDNFACLAAGNSGLRIIDVSDALHPIEVGFYNTPNCALDVFVKNGLAYVADNASGLRIIDIGDPQNPIEVGCYDTPNWALGVFVVDTLAFIADGFGGGMRIINVANPYVPYEIGSCQTANCASAVVVVNNFAYVADGYGGLRIIDVSNPQNPTEIGYCPLFGFACDVSVVGDYAYVVGIDGLDFRIVDISDPTSPQEINSHLTGDAYGISVQGRIAYIANGYFGIRLVDITNPWGLFDVGYYDTPGCAVGISVTDPYGYYYIADLDAGLQIYGPLNTLIKEKNINNFTKKAISFSTICRERIIIKMEKMLNSPVNIKLYDLSGRTVFEKNYPVSSKMIIINDERFSELSPGVYFLSVNTNSTSITEKIIKFK